MPTYEYACKSCGQRFELYQPFAAKPMRRHDVCGGEVSRVIHPRGVLFKGSGFYSTDSRAKSSTDKSPKTKSSTDKSAKTETKAAAEKTDTD